MAEIYGNNATLGNWATLGNDATLGDRATLGDGATLGDRVKIEGVKVVKFFQISNLDGSGRRIHIYIHTEGVLIRAGCFKGDLNSFCEKAKSENKLFYATAVKAAVEAAIQEVSRQGINGGWECKINSITNTRS